MRLLRNLIFLEAIWICASHFQDVIRESEKIVDVCMLESYQVLCLKNEVILMKSATYGRMRIGRCITAEEVDTYRSTFGDHPLYLGCSADVLSIMDRKCSTKNECEIRLSDIPDKNIQPCVQGLKMYLEISYVCLSIADEGRSCSVMASKNPLHLVASSLPHRICGTKSKPWIIEAPPGQKLNISILEFMNSDSSPTGLKTKQTCFNYGVIVDKTGKTNTSICGDEITREKELYLSYGNSVHVIFSSFVEDEGSNSGRRFLLSVEAVGCSDVIPAEDAWLKRNSDSISIGCYSSRQTWQLQCIRGKWTGVLGNCSQDVQLIHSTKESELNIPLSNSGQVLAVVAIGGFTLTICLIIICVGALCLRRIQDQIKRRYDYKTLHCNIGTNRSQHTDQQTNSIMAFDFTGNNVNRMNVQGIQQAPTYSVYVGEGDSNSIDYSLNLPNSNPTA